MAKQTIEIRSASLHETDAKTKAIRIPITNVWGGGDYSAQIHVGDGEALARVILDTGSSAIAVMQAAYDPGDDSGVHTTPLAQAVSYGSGGWAGPVVFTSLHFGAETTDVALSNAPIAVVCLEAANSFFKADGILGLAYTANNVSNDLTSYLYPMGVCPPVTYPWPFPSGDNGHLVGQLKSFFNNFPPVTLPPYFTELEEQGVVPNKFAFYVLRSTIRVVCDREPVFDPENHGWFILGGGEEQKDLYTGGFSAVKVVADVYYNVILKSVQVADFAAAAAQPIPLQMKPYLPSNCFVDSGNYNLALADDVYQAVIAGLNKIDPSFQSLISARKVTNDQIDLKKWPDITFTLEGADGKDVSLICTPDTYWEFDAGSPGAAKFLIGPQVIQGCSILGLPLFNNYYTVFDRSVGGTGVINFAKIKR